MRYLVFIIALFAALQTNAQNNIVYGAGINYTNGAPTFTPPVRTSRVAIDTVTGKWYHFNTPGGWQLIGNTIEEIAGCTAPAYTPGKGDSKVVINNCSPQPELYFYNGSAWVLVGGGSVYAGEGIRIENDTIILDSLNFLDFRTGSALDGDVGRVQWNDTDGTLDLNLKGGNVTLQIGQEEVSLVKHADNSGLIEGRVVYIVGSDGANKTVRYAKADSDATSATTFGLMTESATGGNKAFCTTFGLVRNLNTTNLTEGGIVWLSADTAGTMTAVRPTAPDHGVMIGFCVRKHATQGAIFVQVQNGYELNELHDVFVPSPTNGQVLTWNSTNARWEAITPANQLQTLSTDNTPGNISISSGNTITLNVNDADASATNELQTLSTGTNTLTLSNGGGTVTVDTDPSTDVIGSGTSGQVSFWTGTQTQSGDNGLFWDNTNKRLGVGTNTPTTPLTIKGSGNSGSTASVVVRNSDNTLMFQIDDNNVLRFNTARVNSGFMTLQSNGSTNLTGFYLGSINPFTATSDITSYISGNPRFWPTSGSGTFTYLNINPNIDQTGGANGATRGIFIQPGLVSAPNWRSIEWNNSSGWALYGAGTAPNYLAGNTTIGSTSTPARLHVVGSGTSSSTWTAQFHNSAGNNNALMVRDDGSVGVGINTFSSPLTKFETNSRGRFWGGIELGQNATARIDGNGNYYRFVGAADGFGFYNDFQYSATSGTYYWAEFSTPIIVSSGNATIRMLQLRPVVNLTGTATTNVIGLDYNPTLTSLGNGRNIAALFRSGQVGIGTGTGTPDVSAALDVTSTTQGVLFPRMTTTQRNAIATPADGLVIYNTTDNKLQVRAAGAWVDLH